MSPLPPDDPELSRTTFLMMGYCGTWDKAGRLYCTRSPEHEGKHANRYEKKFPTDTVGTEWA
ncbi:hypothetical protein AB0H51_11265 [Streptomyces griseoluteus]|uniref:hypothetical protein n=1 Tax=Streptomyces griseoluteus TaxID=29306 RepID=UPI0033DF5DAF